MQIDISWYIDSESEPCEEMWNEEEEDEIFSEFKEPEEEPLVEELQPQVVEGHSRALTMWLLHFLLFVQAVFHISDNALTYFIKFFKVFFSVLGRFCKVSLEIAESLPSSLYRAKLCISKPEFRKYVVCKKCHRIYRLYSRSKNGTFKQSMSLSAVSSAST